MNLGYLISQNLASRSHTWRCRLARKRASSILSWTEWDARAQTFYSQFLSDQALCFDVGANLGNRTKIFRKLGARVVCVEPQRACASGLRHVYRTDPMVEVLNVAAGASEGTAQLQTGAVDCLASLSPAWISRVTASQRFARSHWARVESCPVTTLGRLIEQHGTPRFIKIDVEGYEFEVLSGLDRPVPFLSLEFIPECLDMADRCLHRLEELGFRSFNFSAEESMLFEFPEWVGLDEIGMFLASHKADTKWYGDIYARG